jgi:hypothetical protein
MLYVRWHVPCAMLECGVACCATTRHVGVRVWHGAQRARRTRGTVLRQAYRLFKISTLDAATAGLDESAETSEDVRVRAGTVASPVGFPVACSCRRLHRCVQHAVCFTLRVAWCVCVECLLRVAWFAACGGVGRATATDGQPHLRIDAAA